MLRIDVTRSGNSNTTIFSSDSYFHRPRHLDSNLVLLVHTHTLSLSLLLVTSSSLSHLKDLQLGFDNRLNRVETALCKKGTKVSEELLKKKLDELLFQPDGELKFLTCQWEACVLQKNDIVVDE